MIQEYPRIQQDTAIEKCNALFNQHKQSEESFHDKIRALYSQKS